MEMDTNIIEQAGENLRSKIKISMLIALIVNAVTLVLLLCFSDISHEIICIIYSVMFGFAAICFISYKYLNYLDSKGKLSKRGKKHKSESLFVGSYALLIPPIIFLLGMIEDLLGGIWGLIIALGFIGLLPKIILTGKI